VIARRLLNQSNVSPVIPAVSTSESDCIFDLMSEMTYTSYMSPNDKPLVWLSGEVKSPPFSKGGRIAAGFLLRLLQKGQKVGLPHSRPMPDIGSRCCELRIKDGNAEWRIMYRLDPDAVLILEVFKKKTRSTPDRIIDVCRKRCREYDSV